MNKNVLITGSAKGIGKAIALRFAAEGYNVILNTRRSEDRLKETLAEINALSPSSAAFTADVSDYKEAEALFTFAKEVCGGVDILVNNAGISYVGLFNTMEPSQWQELMTVNVNSMLNCTHLALPRMIHNKGGCIINISSMWGIAGASCEAIYSASKGAINAFTKALGRELAPSGILVNAIACGAIDTDMNNFMSPEEKADFSEEIPLGRFGRPEEVADLALYLARDNSYMTGQILSLDGGMM